MVGRRQHPRGASDSIYHQGVNGRGGIVGGVGVGRARQLKLEGKLEKRPRLLLKVICHWARKTNSDQVLPKTGGPSLRSCSPLLPTEVSSFGLHRNLGGAHPTSIRQIMLAAWAHCLLVPWET